jgi:hypothetical protein
VRGVAHRSKAFHGGVDWLVGNNGEGGLLMLGVDGSWFRKDAGARANIGVVAVGVGCGLRRRALVTPSWPMERVALGSWQSATSGGLWPSGSWLD